MYLQEYDISTRSMATVVNNTRLTPPDTLEDVRELTMEVESPQFRAFVGQNIGVLAPGQTEIGQEFHFRLYSIADVPGWTASGNQSLHICVRRCNYIDPYNGEAYPGVASNFLCDLRPEDRLQIAGPYGQAFALPAGSDANLILIGAGTGIAPFRAFVKYLYMRRPDFQGRVLLIHGAQTGLELLYRNDEKDDFGLYYDRETFEAVEALSKRPGWSDEIDWSGSLRHRAEELRRLLTDTSSRVYLAGLVKIREGLLAALAEAFDSEAQMQEWKSRLESEGRWTELLY
jgi:ferredoxin--NADP+ reductase